MLFLYVIKKSILTILAFINYLYILFNYMNLSPCFTYILSLFSQFCLQHDFISMFGTKIGFTYRCVCILFIIITWYLHTIKGSIIKNEIAHLHQYKFNTLSYTWRYSALYSTLEYKSKNSYINVKIKSHNFMLYTSREICESLRISPQDRICV